MTRFLFLLLSFLVVFSTPGLSADEQVMMKYRQKGIVVAQDSDMAPMSFTGFDGQPKGFIIDLWNKWTAETGIPVTYYLVDWADSIAAVRDGRADVHGGLFYTAERDKFLDYSQPFFPSNGGVFVKKEDGITDMSQLSGHSVGVIEKSFYDNYMMRNYPAMKPVRFKTTVELAKAVVRGELNAFVGDYPTIMYQIGAIGKVKDFSVLDFSGERYFCAGVREGDKELLDVVETGLKLIDQDERDSIYNRWVIGPSAQESDWLFTTVVISLICLLLAVLIPFISGKLRD